MGRKKEYEEKQRHGTVELPLGLHKMEYPRGTDAIFYLHWHQEFEFLVVTRGRILFEIEEREYELQAGDGIFVNSNLLHSARTVDEEACAFFAVDFSYQILEQDIHSRFAKRYIRPILNGKTSFPEFISGREAGWQSLVLQALTDISTCPEHNLESCELLVRSRIFWVWDQMMQHAERVHGSEEETRSSERLAPVVKYMHDHYAYEITLAELAELIPMSEGQFCRVFKQTMKLSPMQYLMRYRILQSCRLLQDTDKKIGEIANLSGFNNISYFNKVFLNIIGCTPKQYRANSNY
ncbi:MAG: AraC family transcriptional regulator [Eubacteriales bacterium]|nr:AraC family transcriptional regulator [Eubacteriales bacterium]